MEGYEQMYDECDPWNPDYVPHEVWDCVFPDECLMPGPHTRHECHTLEMVAAWEAEAAEDEGGGDG